MLGREGDTLKRDFHSKQGKEKEERGTNQKLATILSRSYPKKNSQLSINSGTAMLAKVKLKSRKIDEPAGGGMHSHGMVMLPNLKRIWF